ncbi:unnamed protein product [Agarophyton chilense]
MEPVMKPIPWDPYVKHFNPLLVGKHGERVPQSFLDAQMSMSEWLEMRRAVFDKGDDVDQLAFKVLAEMLLSPTLGVREDALSHMNAAIKQMRNAHYYSAETGAYMSADAVPPKLWKREPRFVQGDEHWMSVQSEQDKALHLICENLYYMFDQGEDFEAVSAKGPLALLPFRGGVTGFRSSSGRTERDGARYGGVDVSVERDELFQQIHDFSIQQKEKIMLQHQHQQREQ